MQRTGHCSLRWPVVRLQCTDITRYPADTFHPYSPHTLGVMLPLAMAGHWGHWTGRMPSIVTLGLTMSAMSQNVRCKDQVSSAHNTAQQLYSLFQL